MYALLDENDESLVFVTSGLSDACSYDIIVGRVDRFGFQNFCSPVEYYQVCSNDDPGSTLTYFTARSNLVPYAFVWEKGKTMHFSETIVVNDLKLAAVN